MAASYMEMYATIQAILAAEVSFVRISTPILYILGNIGEILNIIIFVQRTFRTNSCAIYFLAASCIRFVFINFTIFLNYLSIGYNIDPAQTSLIFCKFKFYLSCVTAILPPSFIVLACIDRLMLSSANARTRSWSHPRFACRLVAGVSIFWMLFSVHAIIGTTIYSAPGYSYCFIEQGIYMLFMALYSTIFNYLLPPILMIILGMLTIINVRRIQRQIHSTEGHRRSMQRKDQYLLRMLLFQVLINIIFTIPAAIFQIYQVISATWVKDPVHQTWDLFYFALALTLFDIPNCAGFYIYTLTASIFREELKKIFIKSYHRLSVRKVPTTVILVGMSTLKTSRR